MKKVQYVSEILFEAWSAPWYRNRHFYSETENLCFNEMFSAGI